MPYTACFDKIEALKKEAVSTQAASKLADTSRAIGGFIGKIPVVKEGPVDESYYQVVKQWCIVKISKTKQLEGKNYTPLYP